MANGSIHPPIAPSLDSEESGLPIRDLAKFLGSESANSSPESGTSLQSHTVDVRAQVAKVEKIFLTPYHILLVEFSTWENSSPDESTLKKLESAAENLGLSLEFIQERVDWKTQAREYFCWLHSYLMLVQYHIESLQDPHKPVPISYRDKNMNERAKTAAVRLGRSADSIYALVAFAGDVAKKIHELQEKEQNTNT